MRTGKFIIGILLLCCFIRMVIGEPCTVPSGSMEPTLLCGDRLWINKLAYGGRFPSRWADIPLLNVFTWIRPLRLADEENHWEYRRLPGYSEPKQGDIAVFNSPGRSAIVVGQANYPGGKKRRASSDRPANASSLSFVDFA